MWHFRHNEINKIPDKTIGFVYCITNITNGRKYIGRKNFYFVKYRKIKGRRKKYKIESDWESYWSSCEELKKDVKILGEENFKRDILWFCTNKMQLNYLELREQIDRRVMEDPMYYNELIYARIRKTKNLTGD